ncbi:MAG: Asp-tRNA(Asn)/Glu-tRNA(Gln) amidotransferase subunit GatA [Candidatus Colwellbacteria bacterium]|nr:Asp-tRNA(Asn)/Glu-tRNA(Gln) amidotransferase subunit GatA [Candidatus Colwellbacteria bacterium]
MDTKDLTIAKVKEGILGGDFSAKEIAAEYVSTAKSKNPELNAYISILEESVFDAAADIDRKVASGETVGALAGVPMAIKDNILIKGEKCTAGSKILSDYEAAYNATVITKLKEAGAIIIGKANMDEFAMGSSTENSAFGPVKNPIDIERVPGGSSGGSAAAVAADMALAALGSDTGGSIRQPAAFCGVVGMKPTYGKISRFGVMAMASSLDQIGSFGKTVRDAEAVYGVIKGKDKRDSTSSDEPESFLNLGDMSSVTIGLPDEYFVPGTLDADTETAIGETIKDFERSGAKIKKVSLPHSKYALACYYIIMFAEVSTNLARFDGIRYSRHSDLKTDDLLDIYLSTKGEGFGDEVKRRIILGTFVLSSGYYDAYYAKAQKVRKLIKNDFAEAFKDVDVLLTPVSPTVPFKLGEKTEDPMAMYMSDIFTVPINLAGVPAISIPVAGREGKLPVGFQLIGKHWHDSDLFGLGSYYEGL